ncbi:IS3 family transposase [Corynebacterium sp. 320]|uniref:IS3 family transposase n=1 Tax=Corynebacterium TaxID=1716 RepID=UPI003519F577
MEHILEIHHAIYGVYWVRTMWHAFGREGIVVGREQVARLMRLAGVSGTARGARPCDCTCGEA